MSTHTLHPGRRATTSPAQSGDFVARDLTGPSRSDVRIRSNYGGGGDRCAHLHGEADGRECPGDLDMWEYLGAGTRSAHRSENESKTNGGAMKSIVENSSRNLQSRCGGCRLAVSATAQTTAAPAVKRVPTCSWQAPEKTPLFSGIVTSATWCHCRHRAHFEGTSSAHQARAR